MHVLRTQETLGWDPAFCFNKPSKMIRMLDSQVGKPLAQHVTPVLSQFSPSSQGKLEPGGLKRGRTMGEKVEGELAE